VSARSVLCVPLGRHAAAGGRSRDRHLLSLAVLVIVATTDRQTAQVFMNGGVFLLRQSDLTDLARCVCRSFIRPSVSFLVF